MKIKDMNIKTDYIEFMNWGDGSFQITSFEKTKGVETVINIDKKQVKELIKFLNDTEKI